MAPQLYLTVYNEQFASPGKVKRVQLRPTSAHRRNNPQPPPDFLFPRNMKSSCRHTRCPPHLQPPVDTRGPLFPPVKRLSLHGPRTGPDQSGPLSSSEKDKPPSSVETLPSVGGHKKLQFTEPPASELSWKPPRRVDHLSHSLPSQQQIKLNGAGRRLTRPQTTLQRRLTAAPLRSGCYSCFQVVNRYQAGHYIIHPEFVSEFSR
ncbi:uncharacterized protein LOC128760996 isoform X1 [Synchiropus splendidus]|uniref:uncharacterized protein LOC128760996 isoform X1 n=1 Tax=Synchiropus splendidus TaxID=270530 RepID=UPI00237E4D76|nr:uncharacterized protein LOC128760996 isoform X1 [Synchiropus splendidus]